VPQAPRALSGGYLKPETPRPHSGRPCWTLSIESLAFGGEGIAHNDGKVCFVPGARRRYDRARLHRVLLPSPDRRLPLCPHTAVCGGCVLQTCRYEAQLAAKAEQVRDCLRRIGHIEVDEIGPPLPSPVLSGYRNKMEFTFSNRSWHPEGPPAIPGPGPVIGLHVAGRFDAVFDMSACILPAGASLRVLQVVRDFARQQGLAAWRSDSDQGLLRHLVVREGKNTGEILAAVVTRRAEERLRGLGPLLAREVDGFAGLVVIVNERPATVARGDREDLLWGRPWFRERLAGLDFELQAQSFFQTNTWGAEVLISAIRRMLPSGGEGRLCDLYCGPGTLGLSLARSFREVLGVEQVAAAVSDARRNAARNSIDNACFVEADAEDWCPDAAASGKQFDGVLCDPPRAGLHPRALRGLLALAPSWILYVSCNPPALARDAVALVQSGYEPISLQIVDLFPHTAHIESVLLFIRS
jgi:23S rRNA (uracil1939-C5)-methyltransferase